MCMGLTSSAGRMPWLFHASVAQLSACECVSIELSVDFLSPNG